MSNVFATLITFFCFRHLNYGSIYYISRLYWHAPRWSVDTVFNFHHSLHINQLNQYFLGFSGHSQILSLVLLVLFIAACHTCKELKFWWCWQPTESNDKNLTAVSVVIIFFLVFAWGSPTINLHCNQHIRQTWRTFLKFNKFANKFYRHDWKIPRKSYLFDWSGKCYESK